MSNEVIRIDRTDRRILRALDRDSRQSFNSLQRALHIPAETIRYRVRALVDQGVISFFVGVVNMGKLGCSVHKVLVKLHNVDEDRVQKILAWLCKDKAVNWVARLDGIFDIAFTLWVLHIRDLSDFTDELKRQFHQYISRLGFAVNIDTEFFVRDYLTSSKRIREKPVRTQAPGLAVKFDRTDVSILREIASDTRVSNSDIARKLEITPETVHARIRRLERDEVLSGYRLAINSSLIGEANYYIFVFLNYVSDDRRKKFVEHCRTHSSVVYLIRALGEWDYELNIEVANLNQYREFMMEITRLFSDIVRDYYALPVSSVHKFTMMPEGVEKMLGISA